jgi:pheromone shutdown protein TraB
VLTSDKTGGKLYLVGTAHFSKESQDDVATVIRGVQVASIIP